MRPGEDASCLNLYRPTNPTIIAPEPGFIESNRFTFAASLAATDAERANPWLLLRRSSTTARCRSIADATSLQYVLHAASATRSRWTPVAERPLVLRFVGALQDSVLQGELVIAEEAFVRLFPAAAGLPSVPHRRPTVRSLEDARAAGRHGREASCSRSASSDGHGASGSRRSIASRTPISRRSRRSAGSACCSARSASRR